MQIRVSTRDCRTAVGAAIVALQAGIAEYKNEVGKTSYDQLLEGAIHNGTLVTDALKEEMRAMVDRDIEHMMQRHPGHETLQVLNNFVDMLAYHRGDDIVIDDQDFHLLKKHLPADEVSRAEEPFERNDAIERDVA